MEIKKIAAEETWELRQKVMWPTKNIEYVKLKDDKQGFHYGGFIENNLITVVSLFYQDKEVQFRKFATCVQEQGKGYGTQLLNFAFQEAQEMESNKIWCHARIDKINFYQGFGLGVDGEPFIRDGKEYVLMSRYFNTCSM